MPGHIGTDIVNNSRLVHAGAGEVGDDELVDLRAAMANAGRAGGDDGRRGHPLDG